MTHLFWIKCILCFYYPVLSFCSASSIRWNKHILPIYIKALNSVLALFEIIILFVGIYSIKLGEYYLIIASIFIAIVYLPLMVLLTSPTLNYFLKFNYKWYSWINFIVINKLITIRVLLKTLKEELIWRSAYVEILSSLNVSNPLIIISGTIYFYLIHFKCKKKVILLQELELFLFSFFLILSYILTNSILVVWIIHFIRNSYIIFHKNYVEKNEKILFESNKKHPVNI